MEVGWEWTLKPNQETRNMGVEEEAGIGDLIKWEQVLED